MSGWMSKWSRSERIAATGLVSSPVIAFLATGYQAEIKAWLQSHHIWPQLGQYALSLILIGLGYALAICRRKMRIPPFKKDDVVVQLSRPPDIVADCQRDLLEMELNIRIRNFGERDIPIYSGKGAIRIGDRDFLTFENTEKVTIKAKEDHPYKFTASLRSNVASKLNDFFEGGVSEKCGSCMFQFSVDVPGIDVIDMPAQIACIGVAEVGGPRQRTAQRKSE